MQNVLQDVEVVNIIQEVAMDAKRSSRLIFNK